MGLRLREVVIAAGVLSVGAIAVFAAATHASAPALEGCAIATPEGAPARFIACGGEADGEVVAAIVTHGSHCAAADAIGPGTVHCDDGTAIRLTSASGPGARCEVTRHGKSADGRASCTHRRTQ